MEKINSHTFSFAYVNKDWLEHVELTPMQLPLSQLTTQDIALK